MGVLSEGLKKMNKNKLYLVEWEDAHIEDSWIPEADVDRFIKKDLFLCQDVGWILHEDDKCLVMASSKNNALQWGALKKIPKGWIRKKRLLKL